MKTVLNTKSTDILSQPMFLGKPLGLQRYDVIKYPEFKRSYETQRGQYWQAQEVKNISNDRAQFEALSEAEKFIFVNNLQFQTMGDSCLSRTIDLLKQYVTNSELEFTMNWWSVMENTHSESYSYILQNIVKNPSEFFEDIYKNEAVMKRAEQLTSKFDALLRTESNDPKEEIFRTVLSLQIAEGILFYVSFACSFWFGSRGIMVGNADIIKLIQRDEDEHVAITQNIMKRWKSDPSEGFQEILKNNEELVYEAYRIAVQNEKDWATHLFSKGSLLGLNEAIIHGYVEWLGNIRLRSMGYNQIFETKKNPIGSWIQQYIKSDEVDAAPQEKNILDYEKGKIVNDIDDLDGDYDF
jgi:ribonucleotide reductase beta subunit family protein with ferritin-like domain